MKFKSSSSNPQVTSSTLRVTRGFEFITRGFELVTRGFDLVARAFELGTRITELVHLCFRRSELVFYFSTEMKGDKYGRVFEVNIYEAKLVSLKT